MMDENVPILTGWFSKVYLFLSNNACFRGTVIMRDMMEGAG